MYQVNDDRLARELFGIRFPNPVGLAAGFDKNARMVDDLETLGFGFIEIGTLTPKGQPGNPKPRMFRLPADQGLINRMGFNNDGVDRAVEVLKKRKSSIIVGGNIGKNKVTPNEEAYRDYAYALEALHPVVDYFVVNISSPNTPNLRELQEKEPLRKLLAQLLELRDRQTVRKPLLLKIAPDLTAGQIDDIVEIVLDLQLDGVIVSNTTISRENLSSNETIVNETGGVSGKPVGKVSTNIIREVRSRAPQLPIIGVGGIFTPADAMEKLDAGADLIQVYTGFVYEGPGMVKRINQQLRQKA